MRSETDRANAARRNTGNSRCNSTPRQKKSRNNGARRRKKKLARLGAFLCCGLLALRFGWLGRFCGCRLFERDLDAHTVIGSLGGPFTCKVDATDHAFVGLRTGSKDEFRRAQRLAGLAVDHDG